MKFPPIHFNLETHGGWIPCVYEGIVNENVVILDDLYRVHRGVVRDVTDRFIRIETRDDELVFQWESVLTLTVDG